MIHLFYFHNLAAGSASWREKRREFVVLVEVKCLTNSFSSASENFSTALKLLVNNPSATPPNHIWPVSSLYLCIDSTNKIKHVNYREFGLMGPTFPIHSAVHVPNEANYLPHACPTDVDYQSYVELRLMPQAEAEPRLVGKTA